MDKPLTGLNEALILSVIADGTKRSLSDIIEALDRLKLDREIREATAYISLQRMAERGYVRTGKENVVSRDGRCREVGIYEITSGGRAAVQGFSKQVKSLSRRLGRALGAQ